MATYNNAINTSALGVGFVYSDGSGLLGIGTPSGGGNIIVTKFTANGTFTKNASTKYVEVICWNGGGGGGSGRQGASTAAGGGSGGSSGGVLVFSGYATFFGATETVTIGSGGTGGAAQSSASTNGNAGLAGGISSLGNIFVSLIVQGGLSSQGLGGTSGTVVGGFSQGFMIPSYPLTNATSPSTGGSGRITTGTDGTIVALSGSLPFQTMVTMFCPTAAGGGAGADSVTERSGGIGANYIAFFLGGTTTDTLNAGGTAGLESTTINGGAGNNAITTTGGRYVAATGGGGGGGQSVGAAAGNGGNGGLPAAGGGGGGGSLNGTNSGAGGDGGRGEIWVIEYY